MTCQSPVSCMQLLSVNLLSFQHLPTRWFFINLSTCSQESFLSLYKALLVSIQLVFNSLKYYFLFYHHFVTRVNIDFKSVICHTLNLIWKGWYIMIFIFLGGGEVLNNHFFFTCFLTTKKKFFKSIWSVSNTEQNIC